MTLLFDLDRDGLHEPTWGDRASAGKYIVRTLTQKKVIHDIKQIHCFTESEDNFLHFIFDNIQATKDFMDRHKIFFNPSQLKDQTIELNLDQARALLQQYGIFKYGPDAIDQALVREVITITTPKASETSRSPLMASSNVLFTRNTYGTDTSADTPAPKTATSASVLPASYDKINAEVTSTPSNGCCTLL
jgi:hypothetical protein